MKKQWYDHKTILCDTCAYHRPAGPREINGHEDIFPEGCRLYGYSFHPYSEDAEDCAGFCSPKRYEQLQKMKECKESKSKPTQKR